MSWSFLYNTIPAFTSLPTTLLIVPTWVATIGPELCPVLMLSLHLLGDGGVQAWSRWCAGVQCVRGESFWVLDGLSTLDPK